MIDEQFDAIASVEMVEAVGERWWGAYLDCDRAQFEARRTRRAAVHQHRSSPVRALCDAAPISSRPTFSRRHADRRAATSRRWRSERGLSWDDRDGFAPRLCGDPESWRERYDAAVAARRSSTTSTSIPPSLALLSDVLRGRLPRRRDRRRASHDGQELAVFHWGKLGARG